MVEQLIANKGNYNEDIIALFSHLINAQQIWNSRILKRKTLGVNEIHTLERCREIDKGNFQDSLSLIKEMDLDKKIDYTNSKGHSFQNSIQEILFHVSNHSTHHRAQIVQSLRRNGIEALVTDYIFYKR